MLSVLQEYKGRREGIYLIRGVIMQVYKRNTIRMIEAYYGNTTGINGMDIRGILEQSPNIPKRESFFLSVLGDCHTLMKVIGQHHQE